MTKKRAFRTAKVFGREVPIYKVPGMLEKEDTYGHYNIDEKLICVDETLKGTDLEHTIIHELFHAVLDRLHIQQQMSKAFAEVIIENLSSAVIDNFNVRWKE